jgi:hypothetical protein
MPEHRFDVFGKSIAVIGAPGRWSAFFLGPDGKRRPADFVIPEDLVEDELQQYLADLFHELASPENNEVRRL